MDDLCWTASVARVPSPLQDVEAALSPEEQASVAAVRQTLRHLLSTDSGRRLAIEPFELHEPLADVLLRYGLSGDDLPSKLERELECKTVEGLSLLQVGATAF